MRVVGTSWFADGRVDIRHNSLEGPWLSPRIPFQTVESIICPEMEQQEGKELWGKDSKVAECAG